MGKEKKKKERVVCACLSVTDREIQEAIRLHNIQTLRDLIRYTRAGEGCTSCHPALRMILNPDDPENAG